MSKIGKFPTKQGYLILILCLLLSQKLFIRSNLTSLLSLDQCLGYVYINGDFYRVITYFGLQVVSLGFIAIGKWANIATREFEVMRGDEEREKNIFDYLFDFSLVFIVFGVVVFVFSFIGLIGALRENICLLKTVRIILFWFAGPIPFYIPIILCYFYF